jgi:hypothetical protein
MKLQDETQKIIFQTNIENKNIKKIFLLKTNRIFIFHSEYYLFEKSIKIG